jgi:hypothetical protein
MRSLYCSILFVCVVAPALATYTYVIDEYGPVPDLYGTETLLMIDEGGDHMLNLWDYSSATILGTSPLEEFVGGIWFLGLAGYSTLDFSGGEVHELDMNSYATAILSGGLIEEIWSYQFAWIIQGEPSEWVPNPHITMVCDVDSVFHDTGTNILNGDWLDGSSFSIQLVDIDGYSPAIENIIFIPEPATLTLLALGAVLVRKKR